jgi:serine/threonine protein kinase
VAGPAGRFSLLRPIGANTFASLWAGEDAADGEGVLVEVVRGAPPPEPLAAQTLREHMAATQHLPAHPGLLPVRAIYTPAPGVSGRGEVDVEEDRWLLVLEPFDGSTLYQRAAFGGLTPEAICAVAAKVGEALGALHEVGIPHGSLSPTSVLVSQAGEVRVIDAIVGSWWRDLGRERGTRDRRAEDLAALARLVTDLVRPEALPASVRWVFASRAEPTLDELVHAFRAAVASASSTPDPLSEPEPPKAAADGPSFREPTASADEVDEVLRQGIREDENRSVVVFVPDADDDALDGGSSPPAADEPGSGIGGAHSLAVSADRRAATFTAPPPQANASRPASRPEPRVVAPRISPRRRRAEKVTPPVRARASADRAAVPSTEPTWWMTVLAAAASLVMFAAIGAAVYYLFLSKP